MESYENLYNLKDNQKAYCYILEKNLNGLKTCEFHPRILIERLKNNLEGLEFLLDFFILQMQDHTFSKI